MYLPTEPCVYILIYIYIVMMVHLVFETGFLNVCLCGVCVRVVRSIELRVLGAYMYDVCLCIHICVANQAVYIKLPACPSISAVCGSEKKGVKKVDVQRVCFYFFTIILWSMGSEHGNKKTVFEIHVILTG